MNRVKKLNKNKLTAIRIVLFLLILVWMAAIYLLSADDGAQSEIKSTAAAGWTVLLTDFLDSFFHFQDPDAVKFIFHVAIRKAAHICEYAVLSMLICFFLQTYTASKPILYIPSVAIGALYALFDEYHQTFVPGRSGQLSDMLIDTCGAVLGVFVAALTLHVYKKYKRSSS